MTDAIKYKLIYFDKRAHAEAIRFLFSYGGIPFEDIRITTETWLDMKDSTRFGSLPVLYINDEAMDGPTAICRYLANLVGLIGKTPYENLQIDSIIDQINDLKQSVSDYNIALACSTNRKHLKSRLKNELFPFYYEKLNTIARRGYIACDKCTWADVYLTAFLDYVNDVMEETITENYPHLEALQTKIHSIPKIKEWVAKRPYSIY